MLLFLPVPAGICQRGWHAVSTLCQAAIKRWDTIVQKLTLTLPHGLCCGGLYAEAHSANPENVQRKISFSRGWCLWNSSDFFLLVCLWSLRGQGQRCYFWIASWTYHDKVCLKEFVSQSVIRLLNGHLYNHDCITFNITSLSLIVFSLSNLHWQINSNFKLLLDWAYRRNLTGRIL